MTVISALAYNNILGAGVGDDKKDNS